MRKLLFSTAMLAIASVGPVFAVPISNPGSLTANGNVNAVFAFADAGDTSQLLRISMGGVIFNNSTDSVGLTKNVGLSSGLIQFRLDNLSKGYSFINDVADIASISNPGGDGEFHAKYGSTAADFGPNVVFSSATNTAISNLGGTVILVGFEDLRRANGSDYDYNDLIFAFSSVQVAVPEPASIALLGFSLLGAGMMRRSRPN